VLCLVVLAVFLIEIAVIGRSMQSETDLRHWDGEAIRDSASSCLLFEIAVIMDESKVVPKQGAIDEGAMNP
jgi:hypothetical protein